MAEQGCETEVQCSSAKLGDMPQEGGGCAKLQQPPSQAHASPWMCARSP